MKEITRIHIAKVPYDVEIEAKKELDAYLRALEAYAHDEDILAEVEIRITEILADRGIKKDGVIAKADVEALKQQLGEPQEFKDQNETEPTIIVEDGAAVSRKLFRDTDRAVFGGVLAGIAAFFKVSPVLVRVLFVLAAFASFGTALLVYIVLWIAVPPARSAADKLQMAGRPVTVNAIREMNETESGRSAGDDQTGRRVVTVLLGVASVGLAVIAALVTVFATLAVLFGGQQHLLETTGGSGYFVAAFVLAVLSGVLLTVLFTLTAYASFVQKMTKRVVVSVCIVIAAGLVSFGTALGLAQYGATQRSYYIESNTQTKAVEIPAESKAAKAVEVDAPDMEVKYFVTTDTPHAQLSGLVNDKNELPEVKAVVKGDVLRVSSSSSRDGCERDWWLCAGARPVLEVYGPALEQVTVENDSRFSYVPTNQSALGVVMKNDASLELESGVVDSLQVIHSERSHASLVATTVRNLIVKAKPGSQTEAGTVQSLEVEDGGSCPSPRRWQSRVDVWMVTSGTMLVNGKAQAATSTETGCAEIEIQERNRE